MGLDVGFAFPAHLSMCHSWPSCSPHLVSMSQHSWSLPSFPQGTHSRVTTRPEDVGPQQGSPTPVLSPHACTSCESPACYLSRHQNLGRTGPKHMLP